jgi:tellurium resistance protein TerD
MTINLSKGENINLTKSDSSLTHVRVGLGWKAGDNFDLDASAFLLNADNKISHAKDFVFFNNKESANGAVKTQGDNLTGAGEDDDETITINLTAVPADVHSIAIAVTIHEAVKRGQNFGQVSDAYIRIINYSAGHSAELARFDLDEDASGSTGIVFGTLYRNDGDWKFKANADGNKYTLTELAALYGAE